VKGGQDAPEGGPANRPWRAWRAEEALLRARDAGYSRGFASPGLLFLEDTAGAVRDMGDHFAILFSDGAPRAAKVSGRLDIGKSSGEGVWHESESPRLEHFVAASPAISVRWTLDGPPLACARDASSVGADGLPPSFGAGFKGVFRRCHADALEHENPNMAGRASLTVLVSPTGLVESAEVQGRDGLSEGVVACMLHKLRTSSSNGPLRAKPICDSMSQSGLRWTSLESPVGCRAHPIARVSESQAAGHVFSRALGRSCGYPSLCVNVTGEEILAPPGPGGRKSALRAFLKTHCTTASDSPVFPETSAAATSPLGERVTLTTRRPDIVGSAFSPAL